MQTSNQQASVTPDANLFNKLVFLPLVFGVLGATLLQTGYFSVLSLLNSPTYAWQQFVFLAPWLVPLLAGFGLQVGVFFYMRAFAKLAKQGITGTGPVAASAGISSGSMIACCLHHVVDVLPILGLSAVAVFLSEFQSFLLTTGVVSNIIGLSFILYTIKKHNLFVAGGWMSKIVSFNMKAVFYITFIAGVMLLTLLFVNQI